MLDGKANLEDDWGEPNADSRFFRARVGVPGSVGNFTITFDTLGGSEIAPMSADCGSAVTAPAAPTKTGYTFAGWSPDLPATMPDRNLSLQARWTPEIHNISFDSNGGSEVPPLSLPYGESVTSPATPAKAGYSFAGWIPPLPSTMPEYDPQETAQWSLSQYTISFDSAGGSPVAPIAADYGTAVVPPVDPAKPGHAFAGWSPSLPATMPAENRSVVARWTPNRYTISFHSAGGSEVAPFTADYGAPVVAPTAPTKTGHTFAGWSPSLLSTMPAGNRTVVALWTPNRYTISFNSAGGSVVAPITETYGSVVTAPPSPTKTGHTFAGWAPALPATVPAENRTVVAQWATNRYTITFDSAGGDIVAPIAVDYGAAVTAPPAPTKTGHTFTGWSPTLPATMPAENRTVVAQWTTNRYTVSFNSTGGSAVAPITAYYGASVPAPPAPTKTGHSFVGWSPALPATMPAENKTVAAQWAVNRYTLSFDSAGGNAIAPMTLDYGAVVTAPVPPTRTGYTFAGWSPAIPETMPAQNRTLVAQWTVNRYTITFDSAGGSAVASITADYGATVTAPPAPTKTGYTFAGWSPALPATMPAENRTHVAQWTVNRYSISFDSAGGSEVMPIAADYGATVTAPPAPTKTGHTFAGWSPALPATMPAENRTVVAQWTVNRYTISFDSGGGSAVAPVTMDYGATVSAPPTPSKTGYTFAGWSPALPATMPAENLSVVAQWTVNRYTISFDSDGGNEVPPITADYGTALAAPAPTKTGYTFVGWSPALPTTMPAENLSVVAQWTVNRYTISFDTDGGSEVASITRDYGATVTAPSAPTRTGHTFAGWSPALPATMPAENRTHVAQWTVNRYTISFDTDGGSEVASITKDYGATVTAPSAPTRTGHTFAGWSPALPATMPAENRTHVAQWTVNRYTISFDTDGGNEIAPITADYGATVVASPVPTKTGYTFAGWSPALPATMPAENCTVVAQWTVNRYTITFDTDGGSEIPSITANYGSIVTAPLAPTKTGHTFEEWSPALPETMPSSNLICRAKWTTNHYTIRFHANGGSGLFMSDMECVYGESYTLPHVSITGTADDLFRGWATTSNGSVVYLDEAQIINLSASNEFVIHLYAVLRESPTPIVLDSPGLLFTTGGDSEWFPQVAETNQTVSTMRSGAVGQRSGESWIETTVSGSGQLSFWWKASCFGYGYSGLYVSVDDDQKARIEGQNTTPSEWTFVTIEVPGSGTHAIRWTYLRSISVVRGEDCGWLDEVTWTPTSYSIHFDSNGGTGMMPDVTGLSYGDDQTLPSCGFTCDGNTFVGWASSRDGTVEWTDGETIGGGFSSIVSNDVATLYARWSRGTYTVQFNANGGTGTMPDEAFYVDIPKLLPRNLFTMEGMFFSGWSINENGGVIYKNQSVVSNLAAIGETVQLFAVWGDIPEKCVSCYSFDGTFDDKSGNGHNLDNHGGTFCQDRFGNENGAVSFDGQGHNADGVDLVLDHSFSASCWFKTSVTRTSQGSASSAWRAGNALLFPHHGGNDAGVGLSVGTDGIAVTEHGSGYLPTKFTYDAAIGTDWNHVCMVVENDTAVRLYLNGELVASGSLSAKTKYFTENIGGGVWGYYTGAIDDLMIVDAALSDEEVESVYRSGL